MEDIRIEILRLLPNDRTPTDSERAHVDYIM